MDLPILRYVDIIIGLAVVMLLACTVVTAATQLFLASGYFKSRHLRNGLQDLITEIDPDRLRPHARYIAERCLRHPLLGRNNTIVGYAGWWVRSLWRRWRGQLPLPCVNPADVIQREEIILVLLDWSSEQASFARQDCELAQGRCFKGRCDEERIRLERLREALRESLRAAGIADPDAVAAGIRRKIMENETTHPDQAARIWRAQAVAEAAHTEFSARLHAWYDNTIARVINNYKLTAKVVTSLTALAVCFAIQLDALSLIKRLSQDEEARKEAVRLAQAEVARREAQPAVPAAGTAAPGGAPPSTTATPGGAAGTPAQTTAPAPALVSEEASRQQIAETLAVLREPRLAVIPEYLAWQPIAQTHVCADGRRTLQGRLIVDGQEVPVTITRSRDAAAFAAQLATAIARSGAPVTVRLRGECVDLLARNAAIESIRLLDSGGARVGEASESRRDWRGLWMRMPGILLAWILVSLGTPFWYDLLKRLVGFRSILARKDDEERKARQEQQGPVQPALTGGRLPAQAPPDQVAGGDDERGDLAATGAAG